MRVYVDVDGTLTSQQCGKSFFKEIPKRLDVIKQVKAYADAGHEIFIWSGSTRYASSVAEELRKLGIQIAGAMGKPHLMVDNMQNTLRRRLHARVVLPEDFVKMETPPK